MNPPPPIPSKAVFDCNIYLQALGNPFGASGRCLQAAFEGHFKLLIDQLLLDELTEVAGRPKLARKLRILPTRVDELVVELQRKAVLIEHVAPVFVYRRDPDDAHYINLAIASGAMLVISRDNDLLDLMNDQNPDGQSLRKTYQSLRILTPPQFLEEIRPLLPKSEI